MKRVVSLLLGILLVFNMLPAISLNVGTAAAGEYVLSNDTGLRYEIKNKQVTITGVYGYPLEEVVIPDTLEGYPVTAIGKEAFYYKTELVSVTLPSTLLRIEEGAFCSCSKLTSIVIPEGTTFIGYRAFDGCKLLTSISVPDSVVEIGGSSFSDTGYYNDANNWENNVLYIGNHLYRAKSDIAGDYVVREGTKTIVESAFRWCTELTGVTLPEGLVTIGSHAFGGCSSLVCIHIPASVTTIGESAFSECTALTEVTVSQNNMGYISVDGVLLDKQQTQLIVYPAKKTQTSYVIPESVKQIEKYAFYGNANITNIVIPQGVTTIGDCAFSNCTALASVNIPEGVISIGWCAFLECCALTSMVLPDSVTFLGALAFNGCSELTYVDLGTSLTGIERATFEGCSKLPEIIVPASVKVIKDYAFCGCTALNSIHLSNNIEEIWQNAFENTGYYNNQENWDNDVLYIGNYLILAKGNGNELYVRNGVITVANYAFENGFTKVVFPYSTKNLGEYAFYYCSVGEVDFGGIQRIKNGTFFENSGLTEVDIPGTVKAIEDGAFNYSPNITEFIMHYGVEYFHFGAISECYALRKVVLPASLKEIEYTPIFSGPTVYVYEGSYAHEFMVENGKSHVVIESTEDDFTFYVEDGKATVTGYNSENPVAKIPATYEGVPVTAIGEWAFSQTVVNKVVIPEGVETIGNCAFMHCGNIKDVTLPSTLKTIGASAFFNSSIEEIDIPEGVTFIGGGCFGRSYIKRISLPSTLETIENSIFNLNSSLETITLAEGNQHFKVVDGVLFTADMKTLEEYPRGSKNTSYTVPAGVTTIAGNAFSGSYYLKEVTIPGEVTLIDGAAFDECPYLEKATIYNPKVEIYPNNVFFWCSPNLVLRGYTGSTTHIYADEYDIAFEALDFVPYKYTITNGEVTIQDYIGTLTQVNIPATIEGYPVVAIDNEAFFYNTRITRVSIPEGVRTIGSRVFEGCEALTQVELPSTLESIDWNFVYYCTSLHTITIPLANPYFTAEDGVLYNKDKSTILKYPAAKPGASFTVPDTVKTIAYQAFSNSQNLKTVILPDGLEAIKDNAFSPMAALETMVIPWGVTTLEDFTFAGCENLYSITIPPSVTTIWPDTLYGCSEDLVIYGVEGSDAEYHAKIHGIPFNAMRLTTADGFVYIVKNGTATIMGYNGTKTQLEIPAKVDGYNVTAIGEYAFEFSEVTSIVVPEGVTEIGDNAFCYGKELKSITLPSTLQTIGTGAFSLCQVLKQITIPQGVTTIGENAFGSMINLTAITIPASVTNIEGKLFGMCYALTEILVEEENANYCSVDGVLFSQDKTVLMEYPEGKAGETYEIPDGVTTIAKGAFGNQNYNLKEVSVPATVTQILDGGIYLPYLTNVYVYTTDAVMVDGCFGGSSSFVMHGYIGSTAQAYAIKHNIPFMVLPTSESDFTYAIENGEVAITGYTGTNPEVDLPDTYEGLPVTKIGENAFKDRADITQIILHEGITAIGGSAFAGCSGLTDIALPESLTQIGANAFLGCTGFTNITVPENATKIGESAFAGCSSLVTVTLPENLENIANGLFNGCSSLQAITLPEGITTIGDNAFYGCSSLVSVVVPAGVTSLGASSFENCSGLKVIWIPSSVITIEENAFRGCHANLVIYGVSGSEADRYAKDNGISFNGSTPDEEQENGSQGILPTFEVDNATVTSGHLFEVSVRVKNNPGIVSAKLYIGYDKEVLDLISVAQEVDFPGVSFGPTGNEPFVINWVDTLNPNNETDGVIAHLRFRVKEQTRLSTTQITVSYNPGDVYDFDFKDVYFETTNATVTITRPLPGDLNEDGIVDNKDLGALLRFVNGWGNDIHEGAADVDGNNQVDNKDFVTFQRYLNGWNVKLK